MKYFLKCLYNYFNIKGRARRKEFWFFVLYSAIIIALWNLAWIGAYYFIGHDKVFQYLEMDDGRGLLIAAFGYSLLYLFLTPPLFAVTARRFNDTGVALQSYLNHTLALTLILSLIIVLIVVFFKITDFVAALLFVILFFVIYFRGLFIKGTAGANQHGPDPRIDDPIENARKIPQMSNDDSQFHSSDNDFEPFAPKR